MRRSLQAVVVVALLGGLAEVSAQRPSGADLARFKPTYFTMDEIRANLERAYRPGEERR